MGDGRGEDVVGRQGVDPECLAIGSQLWRRDRREMDDGVGPGERVLGLTEVGQVGDQAHPERAAVVSRVHVEDVVAVLAQVADDPASRPSRCHP